MIDEDSLFGDIDWPPLASAENDDDDTDADDDV